MGWGLGAEGRGPRAEGSPAERLPLGDSTSATRREVMREEVSAELELVCWNWNMVPTTGLTAESWSEL